MSECSARVCVCEFVESDRATVSECVREGGSE